MKPKGSFARARAISGASLKTLMRNPGLLWFPTLAAGLHVLFAGACTLALGLRHHLAGLPGPDLGVGAPLYHGGDVTVQGSTVAGFLVYVGFQIISLTCALALTHAALEALAGRAWSVTEAFARVRERRGSLAGYAVIRATSGLVLGRRRRRGRRRARRRRGPLQRLAQLAWWATTYLTLPVLAREDRGPLASIRRSAALFRSSWREGILGRWTLGWLWVPCFLGCMGPLLVCAALGVDDEAVWLAAVCLAVGGLSFGGVLIGTLDTIYRAALYVFATEGVVPQPFDVPDLHTVWHAGAPDPDAADPDTNEDAGRESPED